QSMHGIRAHDVLARNVDRAHGEFRERDRRRRRFDRGHVSTRIASIGCIRAACHAGYTAPSALSTTPTTKQIIADTTMVAAGKSTNANRPYVTASDPTLAAKPSAIPAIVPTIPWNKLS